MVRCDAAANTETIMCSNTARTAPTPHLEAADSAAREAWRRVLVAFFFEEEDIGKTKKCKGNVNLDRLIRPEGYH